jgi:cytochrome c556
MQRSQSGRLPQGPQWTQSAKRARMPENRQENAGMRLRRTQGRRAMLGLLIGGIAASVALAATPDDIIAQRQAGYKHIGDLFKGMKDGIDSGAEVTPFAPQAKEIADWGRKVPSLFPPGTETGHKTKARPEIWSDRPGFEKDAATLAQRADKLSQVAATGDKAAFAAQWKSTAQACGACHKSYRYKES